MNKKQLEDRLKKLTENYLKLCKQDWTIINHDEMVGAIQIISQEIGFLQKLISQINKNEVNNDGRGN